MKRKILSIIQNHYLQLVAFKTYRSDRIYKKYEITVKSAYIPEDKIFTDYYVIGDKAGQDAILNKFDRWVKDNYNFTEIKFTR